MGTSVWYLIASLFLVFANGEIFDNISKSFYDKSGTSTPKPNQRLSAIMEEYVLYLTPEQAQALEATGAIVRPLPQLENALQLQRYQQSIQGQAEPQEQNIPTQKEFPVLINSNKFYKKNNQRLYQALAIQSESPVAPSAKPPPKYKYSPKVRQEYGSLYVQKKNNKTNTQSTEYVRYLPNYEIQVLKMEPYSAQPLPGYYHDETQANPGIQQYAQTGSESNSQQTEPKKPDENVPEFVLIQNYEDVQKPSFSQINSQVQNNQELQEKEQKPVFLNEQIRGQFEAQKLEGILQPFETLSSLRQAEFKENEKILRAEEISEIIQLPTRTLSIQRMQNQQPSKVDEASMFSKGPVTFDDKIKNLDNESEKLESSTQIPSTESPSTLVEPEKISESIAQQKDLISNERVIQNKLQQIKESGTHNEEKFAIELDKLKKNLGKQNILAQKLASQSLPTKTPGFIKEELALQRQRSSELTKGLEPPPVIIPRPYPIAWGVQRPSPVPVSRPEKVEHRKHVPIDEGDSISIPRSKNFYTTISTPYLAREVIPVDYKHDMPFAYRIREPENLTILRPIWEH